MDREFDQASTDRLLAALYDEPAGEQTDIEPSSRTSADELELSALVELRAMLAGLPEEEPPSSVTAKLLAAAARPVRQGASPIAAIGAGGLWARLLRWFQPLIAHPALAAVASLVLVASIGGLYYATGADKASEKAEETAAVQSAPDDQGEPAARTRSAGSSEMLELGEGGADGDAPASGDSFEDKREARSDDRSDEKSLDAAKNKAAFKRNLGRAEAKKPGVTTSGSGAGKLGGEKAPLEVATSTEIDLSAAQGKGKDKERDTSGASLGSRPETGSVPTSPPVSPKQEPVKDDSPDAQTRGKSDTAESAAALAALKRKARAAAKKGDCAAVKKVGDTVRRRDGRYYDTVFLRDQSIGGCYRARK